VNVCTDLYSPKPLNGWMGGLMVNAFGTTKKKIRGGKMKLWYCFKTQKRKANGSRDRLRGKGTCTTIQTLPDFNIFFWVQLPLHSWPDGPTWERYVTQLDERHKDESKTREFNIHIMACGTRKAPYIWC